MKHKEHWKRTLAITWPCILENIMVSISTFADSIMVSQLGTEATAAVGINSTVTWLINAMSTGLAVGGTVIVANYIGAKKRTEANETALQTMNVTFILSAAVTVLMVLLSSSIPRLMGAEESIMPDAVSYLRIYSFSIFAHFCGLVVSGILRGAGNTKTPMYIRVAANILNILGNLFLIYEPWNFSIFSLDIKIWGAGMGVTGAALATSLSQIFAGIILIVMIFDKRGIVSVDIKKLFKFDFTLIKKVLFIGLPAAGERISVSMGQIFFQMIIAGLGTVAVAANYMATTAESISYMPANALSVAATTLVGQSLGAKNKEDALIYSRINIWLSIGVGIIAMLALLLVPEYLIMLFSKEPEVIQEGSRALRTMAIAEPFFCLSIIYVGILRGAGDTKIPLISSIIGMWGVRLITAYFFAHILGFGLAGAWIGMALDLSLRFFIMGHRYIKKKWLYESLNT